MYVQVSRLKLGVWKIRIETVLDRVAGTIPDSLALALEMIVKDIDLVTLDWEKHKDRIEQGNSVRL